MLRTYLKRRRQLLSGLVMCTASIATGVLHALPSIDLRVDEQLERFGAARVLVVFATPPTGESASFFVNATTQSLRDTLADDAFSVRRISGLPIAVAEVNRAGLEQLEDSSLVTAIYADEPQGVFLHESLPLMEIDVSHEADILGSGYSVAILDTGVNYNHPFLRGKLRDEACFSTSDSDVYQASTLCPNGLDVDTTMGSGFHCRDSLAHCSHGTHVAGIALGVSGFGQTEGHQISGVAPSAGLIAIQVFTEFSNTSVCGGADRTPCIKSFPSDQLAALEHVLGLSDEFEIAAVNMSLGGGHSQSECNDNPLRATINKLRALGVATVISSGNDGYYNAVSEPACIPEAISVGASQAGDIVPNIGFSNISELVDFVAPGTDITSSMITGFGESTGTSMAAPHITGTVALLRSHVPRATVGQIEVALQATSKRTVDPRTGVELHFPDVFRAADTLRMLAGEARVKDAEDTEFSMKKAMASVLGAPRIMVVVDEDGIVKDEIRYQEAIERLQDKFAGINVSKVINNRFILENSRGIGSPELTYVIQRFGNGTKLYGDSPSSTHVDLGLSPSSASLMGGVYVDERM